MKALNSSKTKRVVEILDAKYEKADLPAIIFELLFNGTLGDWKLLLVSFELKEGMKPYHGKPYPILHKHKAVLMKEIKWLCGI